MGSSGSFVLAGSPSIYDMDHANPSPGLLPNISWLPCMRGSPFMPRAITANAIESRHNDDWFFRLASAMIERGECAQGKLFARLYSFMMDFIPGGFAGQRFGHLLGGDIMNYVLSSTGETAPSRHKLTKDIEAAWQELEAWMNGHSDWRAALEAARTDNRLTPAQQKARRRDPSAFKAPGLVLPAGIVALLAIAHPDRLGRFTDRIEALHISWMFERRDSLDVKGGFWDGINHDNVDTCFRSLSLPSADTEMLVDYTRLFGNEFCSLRRDIRPGLPMWASNLALKSPAAAIRNEDQFSDGGPEVEEISEAPVDRLRRLLTPAIMTPALEQLLRDRLIADDLIQRWAQRWIDAVRETDHAIRRSLFYQSARSLVNFLAADNVDFADAETYMLLDLYDAGLGPSKEGDFRQVLDRLEPFGACKKALTQLCRVVNWDSEAMIARLTLFAAGVFTDETLTKYAMSILRVEELRMRIILQDLPGKLRDVSKIDDMTVQRLGITNWQRLLLLVRGPEEVLTPVQLPLLNDPAAVPPPLVDVGSNTSALQLLFPDGAGTTDPQEHGSPLQAPELAEDAVIGIFDDVPDSSAEKDCNNIFAGLKAPRELKRPGSYDSLRRKKARFGVTDDDELIGELRASHHTLRQSLLEELRQDFSKLHEDIMSKVQAHLGTSSRRIADEVQATSTQLLTLQSDTKHLMEMQTTMFKAVQECQKISQHVHGAVADAEAEAAKSHEALHHMLSVTQEATHQLIKSEVSTLKGPPVPAPGDFNFLAHNCPAPPGWGQKRYEGIAYQAANFYVSLLGNPSAGFYGDENAFRDTTKEYPVLSQEHLLAALRHYHSLLHDRPFLRKPEDE